MHNINDFILVLNELVSFFDSLLVLEDKKMQAIKDNNILHLEDCMKEEQVYILKLRGLDKKREAMLLELGYNNMTLSSIVSAVDSAYSEKLRLLFESLSTKMTLFQSTNKSSKELIELNLYRLETLMAKSQATPSPGIYGKSGEKNTTSTVKFTSRKI